MSDLGSLSGCMLENDVEARSRARKLRQKALVASIVFEAALLGAMLVWPLITPGVLQGRFIVTPRRHTTAEVALPKRARIERASTRARHQSPHICSMCAPAVIPRQVRD